MISGVTACKLFFFKSREVAATYCGNNMTALLRITPDNNWQYTIIRTVLQYNVTLAIVNTSHSLTLLIGSVTSQYGKNMCWQRFFDFYLQSCISPQCIGRHEYLPTHATHQRRISANLFKVEQDWQGTLFHLFVCKINKLMGHTIVCTTRAVL